VGYVGFVMKDRAADRFGLPHVSIKPMLMRTALAFGMRLPVFLRSTYIFTVYGRALGEYVPRPYTGPALLLKGDTRTYRLNADWPQLLTGPSQLFTVEAEHLQMPDGRYIPLWAEPLKGALVEAQQRAGNGFALPPV